MDNILQIQDMTIEYKMKKYSIKAIDNVTLNIVRGKVTALVGESGSGKTTLVSAILRCISSPGEITSGKILYNKSDKTTDNIVDYTKEQLNSFRWKRASMVFQASQNTLNPIVKIGDQFFETAYYHGMATSRKAFDSQIRQLLANVKLDVNRVIDSYPHELSGGMKQRVMIAFSMLLDPDIIILDEPTTALDVITQNYIFEILAEINKSTGKTMILLTHDIGVVAKFADYVGVMYAGKLVEYGDVYEVFDKRLHPYTRGLIQATPSLISDIKSIKSIDGVSPDIMKLPEGCSFRPRCPFASATCANSLSIKYSNSGHQVLCHLYDKEK